MPPGRTQNSGGMVEKIPACIMAIDKIGYLELTEEDEADG